MSASLERESFSPSLLWQVLKELSEFGSRWSGSRGEAKAGDYLHKKFIEVGLQDVRKEDFEFVHYAPEDSKLRVLSPISSSIECEPFEYTENAEAEGELIYLGNGSQEEFQELDRLGVKLSGKIAAARSSFPFWVGPALERGSIGLIAISDAPANLIRSLTANHRMKPLSMQKGPREGVMRVPGVVVSAKSGDSLLRLMSSGKVRVSLTHRARYFEKKSSNIIGTVPGTSLAEEKVIIGAHYDTQMVGGAHDNGTGVTGLVETARVLAKTRPKRTLVFVAFSCEEVGLVGSTYYVEKRKEEIEKNYVCMVNLDSISSILCTTSTVTANSNSVADFAVATCREENWPVRNVNSWIVPFTDAQPFLEMGVPIIRIVEHYPSLHPYYHTSEDKLDYIDPVKLSQTLRANAVCAAKSASLDTLPYSPRT